MGWKTVALAVLTACGTGGTAPPERVAPPEPAAPAVPPDAGAVDAALPVADAAPLVEEAPVADAAPPIPNPFAGKPCPPPKKVKVRRGRGDRSKPLVAEDGLEPRLKVWLAVGDPTLPVAPDPLMMDDENPKSKPEEEVFCGPVVERLFDGVRVSTSGANGPEDRLITISLSSPLELPFAVGDPIVVRARETVGLFGPARLSVMITDADGDLLLAVVEGREKRFVPGFHVQADEREPSSGSSRRPKGARRSRPTKPRDRPIWVSRAGVRGETEDQWRLLETRDGRWAIWGVNRWDGEVGIGGFRWRLRVVRMPAD